MWSRPIRAVGLLLLFVVSLVTAGAQTPVHSAWPVPGSTVRELARIDVHFNVVVTNVDAADLLVNGFPATNLHYFEANSGWIEASEPLSARDYRFEFTPPGPGEAVVEWSGTHQIASTNAVPESFEGGNWMIVVDPNAEDLVIINEFMTRGFLGDWIELYNGGSTSVDLAGWYLTDQPDVPTLWQFPFTENDWRIPLTQLPPDAYLIVRAYGFDYIDPSGVMSVNFRLSSAGDYLALVRPDGMSLASEFSPVYPPQQSDVSYGPSGVTTLNAYFDVPTPGGPNVPGRLDIESIRPPTLAERYLRITEIMYHAVGPPAGSSLSSGDFDFIELKNIGPVTIDLSRIEFTDGIDFAFGTGAVTSLDPGEYVLVVANESAFGVRYGNGLNIAGTYSGGLNNTGERIRLELTGTRPFTELEYRDDWYSRDAGFSLVIADEGAPIETWGLKESWRPSNELHGSPGRDDPLGMSVLVNEALAFAAPPYEDFVELFNPTTNDVDVSHWYLTDSLKRPRKYRFPEGVVIPSGEFLAIDEHSFNRPTDPPDVSFSFNADGDEIYLLSADADGELTGWVHGFSFGPSETNTSFGRHVISTGDEHFVAQRALSVYETNAGPEVGPMVISEIMYHPPDPSADPTFPEVEYIELRNVSGEPVHLFDPSRPTNTWHLSGAVGFFFPSGLTIPPGGYVLVVDFDPFFDLSTLVAFRSHYSVAPEVPIVGHFAGGLNNAQETILLSRPRNLSPDDPYTNQPPHILVERVSYSDQAPWPGGADGTGHSLQRVDLFAYGNDPANWVSAVPTPGAAYAGGTFPVIEEQPADQAVAQGAGAVFTVRASGAGPFRYQWLLNGSVLPGRTNSLLVLDHVLESDLGFYQAVVLNAEHSVLSRVAELSLLPNGPRITGQPQSLTVFAGLAATLTVEASGSGALHYQWQRITTNGYESVSGGTAATLVIDPVAPELAGDYLVAVYDEEGVVVSESAILTVPPGPTAPIILQQPQDQRVPIGDNVLLETVVDGTWPITFQWSKDGVAIPAATNSSLALTNIQAQDDGFYILTVSNAVAARDTVPARLTVLYPPVFVTHPLSQSVVEGGSVTFSVQTDGTLPMGYRWRRGGATLFSTVLDSHLSFFTVTNVQLEDQAIYTVVATNEAFYRPGILSEFALLTVLPDADGDLLDNDWELANGFNPNDPADAEENADDDPHTNREEYEAGTDPRDASSFLRIESVVRRDVPDVSVGLTFAAVSNRTYTVQYADVPEGGVWQPLRNIPATATNRMVEVDDGTLWQVPERYYRVVTPVRP